MCGFSRRIRADEFRVATIHVNRNPPPFFHHVARGRYMCHLHAKQGRSADTRYTCALHVQYFNFRSVHVRRLITRVLFFHLRLGVVAQQPGAPGARRAAQEEELGGGPADKRGRRNEVTAGRSAESVELCVQRQHGLAHRG